MYVDTGVTTMMNSLWDDAAAQAVADDPLALRVYTSRLLGQEPSLVLHGGGNTSVKAEHTNLFGETETILYVKGSGWDLATIEKPGFAPVRLDTLLKMASLPNLSDSDMVNEQRAAMIDPHAPNPSVEAILHAIIPATFVDHTHADAVVTISNSPDGEAVLRQLYGDRVMIVPYVMPGFVLAKQIHGLTRGIDWSRLQGIILMGHGVFTFDDSARQSYEQMIRIVAQAENYLDKHQQTDTSPACSANPLTALQRAALRAAVSSARGTPVLLQSDSRDASIAFANRVDVGAIAGRGPLTPDHVIRTKRTPMITDSSEPEAAVKQYVDDYHAYFERHKQPGLCCLDPAPRWALIAGHGMCTFGTTVAESQIIADIGRHTIRAIGRAEQLGGWQALPEQDIFELEYWELEQAKLGKASSTSFRGRIALVSGAASGIGAACVESLLAAQAVVIALDINPAITDMFDTPSVLGLDCDMNNHADIRAAVEQGVCRFGGLDIVISNAGCFPPSCSIEQMPDEMWQQSINLNLTSHQRLLHDTIPFLKLGIEPSVIIIASKNVPAPGPGAAAYSAAKAGLTQLARVAALELGSSGIRVNVLHPNAVFDTAIWTDEILSKRAASYGLSVEAYKTNNVLGCEVHSADVAAMACAMAGPLFACTTGAQLPLDGGNERVI